MNGDALFWIWLSERLGAANRDFKALIELYGTPYDIFHAEESEIERISSIGARTVTVLADKSLEQASKIIDRCEQEGIRIVTYHDEAYPKALREIKDPPVLLYYKGTLPDWNRRLSIGMVGTRRMSAYGLRMAYKIAYELASAGSVVVSGMAAGIDGVSSAAAVMAGGATVAVLGCGVDVVYPKHHKLLAQEIAKNGVLLSEYAPGTRPYHYHFPTRNRIISGLSAGTVVVEAGIGSGSLITAKDAVLQGREIFAVPANVGSAGAEGTNGLLRDGANLLLDTTDLLEHYLYTYAEYIDLEAYRMAREKSTADLSALEKYGVIELTQRAEKKEPSDAEAACEKQPATQGNSAAQSARKSTAETKRRTSSDALQRGQKKDAPKPKPVEAPATPKQSPDSILTSLSSVQLAVMQAIPDDHPVTADSLANLGYPYSEIITALTMLEILGLIRKLPGALYTKA